MNVAIIGASGGLGQAFTKALSKISSNTVFAFSRSKIENQLHDVIYQSIEFENESSIREAASLSSKDKALDLVIVCSGILHGSNVTPEKTFKELDAEQLSKVFFVNTIGPALIAKHFLPKLSKTNRSVFTVLSARVGSISDNYLGGWHSYRSSKAALNMMIKCLSVEMSYKNKESIVIALHPGTVDTELSAPFQKRIDASRLFTPEYSAKQLLDVIDRMTVENTGRIYAWDGIEIQP